MHVVSWPFHLVLQDSPRPEGGKQNKRSKAELATQAADNADEVETTQVTRMSASYAMQVWTHIATP